MHVSGGHFECRRGVSVAGQLVLHLVDGVPRLVGNLLDALLHVGGGLVGLAFTLQIVVVGEVACGFFDPTLGFVNVGVAHGCRLSIPDDLKPLTHVSGGGLTRKCERARFGSKRTGTDGAHMVLDSEGPQTGAQHTWAMALVAFSYSSSSSWRSSTWPSESDRAAMPGHADAATGGNVGCSLPPAGSTVIPMVEPVGSTPSARISIEPSASGSNVPSDVKSPSLT